MKTLRKLTVQQLDLDVVVHYQPSKKNELRDYSSAWDYFPKVRHISSQKMYRQVWIKYL